MSRRHATADRRRIVDIILGYQSGGIWQRTAYLSIHPRLNARGICRALRRALYLTRDVFAFWR